MSFAWVASILRLYPRADRPELMFVEAYYGHIFASNGHVILMSPTTLPDGVYDFVTGHRCPNRLYPSKVDRMLDMFASKTQNDTSSGAARVISDRVSFGIIDIQSKYWGLVRDGSDNLRVGWNSKRDFGVIIGSNPNGVFCIAGLR